MTGAEIMKHRRKMNYTTDKLAQKVGVTVDTVQKWERDIMKPRENNRVRLHVVLGLGHPFRRKLTNAQRLAEQTKTVATQKPTNNQRFKIRKKKIED